MFDDSFKSRYTTIPFAIYERRPAATQGTLVAHNHKELELIAMTSGTAEFYVDSRSFSLTKGDLLVIPPYCIHHAALAPYTGYDCACFDLSLLCDRALGEALTEETVPLPPLYAEEPATAALHTHAREAIRACREAEGGWELAVAGHLSLLFSHLKARGLFAQQKSSKRDTRFCRAVMAYISEHYAEGITSQTLARELYVNGSYFCRLFKATFGTSFSVFLTSYRLERARLLLTESRRPISEIALSCGFHSFSYFGKTFKEAYGVIPSAYRRGPVKEA